VSRPIVVVTERGYRRFVGGHPWIYRGDLVSTEGGISSGDIVLVRDGRARNLGFAFFSSSSLIALRMLSREEEPDEAFFKRRIERAVDLRRRLRAERAMERVVYGESDGIPSFIVDRYGDVVVFQTLCGGADRIKEMLVGILRDLLNPRSVVERNDPSVRKLEGLEPVSKLAWGEPVDEVWCREGELDVLVRPLVGQKTGVFLDQQENHEAARAYARGRVLDGFSYQGGFALQVATRAESVLAVESSADALTALRANAARNGVTNVETREANVFDQLTELSRRHERFDMVILDPPAFAKNKEAIAGALRGYKEINLRAMNLLGPGGILLTCSCSYHLTEPLFVDLLREAAADTGRSLQLLERRTQSGITRSCWRCRRATI